MTTAPDPKTVREVARKLIAASANKVFAEDIFQACYTAVPNSASGYPDPSKVGALYTAVAAAIPMANVTTAASWPDEQQHPAIPLTVTELAELRAAVDHLSGPDAFDEDRLEPALIPVMNYMRRMLAAAKGQPQDEWDALGAWLDARQADIAHDHDRPGMTPDSCYCGLPKPCEQRADDMAAVEQLRAVLGRRAELVAENMRLWAQVRDMEDAQDKRDGDVPDDLYWSFTGGMDTCFGEHDGEYRECCWRAGLAYVLKLREQQVRAKVATERDGDVRAVAALLKLGDVSFRGTWLTDYDDARSELETRFASQIAALEARDAKGGER